jgi:hypothetical protein
MSETPRIILHLTVGGFPADRLKEIAAPSSGTNEVTEIFPLNEANAGEALGKIFAADTIAVWGKTE